MKRTFPLLALAGLVALGGCQRFPKPKMSPLGAISDPIWQRQEHNAEASDFVVYQHEFQKDGTRLNERGEDHVKEIAQRLLAGQDFPVIIEQSNMTARPDTKYQYPVHRNPQLDLQRRAVIARALAVMGVHDADQRAVVAPDIAEPYRAREAIRAYNFGIGGRRGGGFGGGGFGGGGGGFGGGGFF